MVAGSKFVDLGDFFENRSIPDRVTSLRIQMKESIYLSLNRQATKQVCR